MKYREDRNTEDQIYEYFTELQKKHKRGYLVNYFCHYDGTVHGMFVNPRISPKYEDKHLRAQTEYIVLATNLMRCFGKCALLVTIEVVSVHDISKPFVSSDVQIVDTVNGFLDGLFDYVTKA